MSQIDITGLTFAYDGTYDNVFENVSFRMDTDWRLGFTGRNGRGKTTFLKLLTGQYEYTGSIKATVGFEYFPYAVPEKNAETAAVFAAICPDAQEWELLREMAQLELGEDVLARPFYTLSNGEQTKILLVALFLKENRFLLIDEPTNHLDMAARELVSRYLRAKKGFILVSHDRAFLDGCIDHVLAINKTDIELRRGNFSAWLEDKTRRDNFEIAENEKLGREVKRLGAAAQRTAGWSDSLEKTKRSAADSGYVGHKAAKMMKRSKNAESRRQKALEDKSRLLKNIEESEDLKIAQIPYHTNRLLSFDDVSIYYGDKPACTGVSFTLERGDRAVLRGRNGSGKSSIIKLILGADLQYTGSFIKGSQLTVSYVPQDASGLAGSLSEYAEENGIDESLFKAILRKLDFSRVQFEKDMSDFSGGQKKKTLIAKSLCEKANLLVWDEPLNFIDVISRIQIEKLLLDYKPTILFVEHDSVFCDKIATKVISL